MPKISPLNYQKLAKVFELEGWELHGQKGSHLHYVKPGFSRPVIIPTYKEIPVFIIQNNLKTAQISRNKYFKLLAKK